MEGLRGDATLGYIFIGRLGAALRGVSSRGADNLIGHEESAIPPPTFRAVPAPSSTALIPLCAVVFLGFLSVGLPLPVLPLHVRGPLGFGPTVVGFVMGLQSLAALATRHYSGTLSDAQGPRTAVRRGLVVCAASGLLYLLSLLWASPTIALAAILLGRAVLGLGESLLITGALAWALGRAGPGNSGRVFSWNGVAMYGALALGAPLGAALGGFAGLSLAVVALPLVALAVASRVAPVPASGGVRLPFRRVVGLVWKPGAALALATLGYGGLAAFGTLYFQAKGWAGAPAALFAFGGAYVLVRLFLSHLPDRLGGARAATLSLAFEVVGQALLGLAPAPWAAFLGAALTGLGFSLVFPAFGIEAVSRVPAENRGAAMGAYAAFFDVALGFVGPLSGALAGAFGYPSLFLLGALGASLSLAFALDLSRKRP